MSYCSYHYLFVVIPLLLVIVFLISVFDIHYGKFDDVIDEVVDRKSNYSFQQNRFLANSRRFRAERKTFSSQKVLVHQVVDTYKRYKTFLEYKLNTFVIGPQLSKSVHWCENE